jgi:hypothetical protein
MITIFATGPGRNIITVEHIDTGKEARRTARKNAQKPGATRKIEDKRKKKLDRIAQRELRIGHNVHCDE